MFWLKTSKYKSQALFLGSRYIFTPREQNNNFSKRPVKIEDYQKKFLDNKIFVSLKKCHHSFAIYSFNGILNMIGYYKTWRTLEKACCNISKFDRYKLGAIWRPRHPMSACPVTRRAPILTWIH